MTTIGCTCGTVSIEISGDPIINAECHCTSCREGSERMQRLTGVPHFRNANGGTPYVLYRKDRVRFLRGMDLLREFRLKPDSPTRRVVASCCNTPVFVEFKGGHWLSLYTALWPAGAQPAMDIRTQTGDVPAGTVLDDAVPSGTWTTARFYALLLGAWIAMGFKVPAVEVPGTIAV